MDFEEIKLILAMVREHDLAEFELEHQGFKIRIRKDGGHPVVVTTPVAVAAAVPAVAAQAPAASAPAPSAEPVTAEPVTVAPEGAVAEVAEPESVGREIPV